MRARAGAFCPVLGVGNFCCCWTFRMKASRVCDVGQGGALEVDRSRLDPSSVFIASVGSVWASECRFLFCEMKHRLPPSTCNLFKVAERATNITSPFAIFVNLPRENFWMRLLSWRRGVDMNVGTLNRKMRKIFSMKSIFLLLPSGICKIFADYLTYMRKKKNLLLL